ncbi:hypothetical protein ACFE04_007814 [Oxalis oulophora]
MDTYRCILSSHGPLDEVLTFRSSSHFPDCTAAFKPTSKCYLPNTVSLSHPPFPWASIYANSYQIEIELDEPFRHSVYAEMIERQLEIRDILVFQFPSTHS